MGVNRMTGVSWHVELGCRVEGDSRRSKKKCAYFSNGECSKYFCLCFGSAHCKKYKVINSNDLQQKEINDGEETTHPLLLKKLKNNDIVKYADEDQIRYYVKSRIKQLKSVEIQFNKTHIPKSILSKKIIQQNLLKEVTSICISEVDNEVKMMKRNILMKYMNTFKLNLSNEFAMNTITIYLLILSLEGYLEKKDNRGSKQDWQSSELLKTLYVSMSQKYPINRGMSNLKMSLISGNISDCNIIMKKMFKVELNTKAFNWLRDFVSICAKSEKIKFLDEQFDKVIMEIMVLRLINFKGYSYKNIEYCVKKIIDDVMELEVK